MIYSETFPTRASTCDRERSIKSLKIARLHSFPRTQTVTLDVGRSSLDSPSKEEYDDLMNSAELAKLKILIIEEISECKESIIRLGPSAKPISPDNAIGRLSRADGMNDQGISSAALSHVREKLYKLELSLGNLQQPGFGACRMCSNPISIERLAALPESTQCMRCATR